MFSKGFHTDLPKGGQGQIDFKVGSIKNFSFFHVPIIYHLITRDHPSNQSTPLFIIKKKRRRKMAEWIKYSATSFFPIFLLFLFSLLSFLRYFLRRKNRSLGRQTQLAHRRLIANKILIREKDCIDSRRKLHRDFHFYSRDSVHICWQIDRRSNS